MNNDNTIKNEYDYLASIKASLTTSWSIIDYYNNQSNLSDYSAPIIQSGITAELIIALIAYENGYLDANGKVLINASNRQYNNFSGPSFSIAINYMRDIFPEDVCEFLNTIRKYRNVSVHCQSVGFGEAVMFSEAFNCFFGWFLLNSKTLSHVENKDVFDFLQIVKDRKNNAVYQIIRFGKDGTSESTYQSKSVVSFVCHTIANGGESQSVLKEIQSGFRETRELLTQVMEGNARIERKIDRVTEKLDEIERQICGYQLLLEKQLELAVNESEIDRILSAFADECSERITREIKQTSSEKAYETEKIDLISSLGESAWGKLDPASQEFLLTAKVTYRHFLTMSDIIDYSGVCLLVTKAVELEMNRRFCRDFISYLKEKYPGASNYHLYPTVLLDKYGKPIRPKHFTLGTVSYVLCRSEEDLTEEQKQNNRNRLKEFFNEKLMVGKSDLEMECVVDMIVDGVESVRKDYRNPSAHTNRLRSINARECFDLVLDVEKLLRKILDALDY